MKPAKNKAGFVVWGKKKNVKSKPISYSDLFLRTPLCSSNRASSCPFAPPPFCRTHPQAPAHAPASTYKCTGPRQPRPSLSDPAGAHWHRALSLPQLGTASMAVSRTPLKDGRSGRGRAQRAARARGRGGAEPRTPCSGKSGTRGRESTHPSPQTEKPCSEKYRKV